MTNQSKIQLILLLAVALLPGCVTRGMWHEKSGPGVYKQGDVERQSVTALYILRSSDGATFLVPGHPDEQSIFALTVPEYTRDIDRFRENFASPDQPFNVEGVKMMVAPYEGKGYRVDVDFTSTLPVDRVVELFAGSGVGTEEEYKRVMHEGNFNFHIHYGDMANFLTSSQHDVSHYTYSMTDRFAEVRAGVLPIANERGLLTAASHVPLRKGWQNFTYSVYEQRRTSRIPLPYKVAATPLTLTVDALLVAVATPVVLVVLMSEAASSAGN